MWKLITPIPKIFRVCRMGLFKQTAVNMISLKDQFLGYNKICMGFNPGGGACPVSSLTNSVSGIYGPSPSVVCIHTLSVTNWTKSLRLGFLAFFIQEEAGTAN